MIQALIGITIGIVIGKAVPIDTINSELVAIITVNTINSILAGVRAKLNSTYNDKVIFSDFSMNFAASIILVFIGSYIRINLYYLALIALVMRIFSHLSAIRQQLIKNL